MAAELTHLVDDGLITPEVGSWAEDKYRLLAVYDSMFSTSMREKWDQRVYVDLFAGAGRSRIEGTNTIYPGSPLLALDVAHPFDRYVFCEDNDSKLAALETRVKRDFLHLYDRCRFLEGDANELVPTILTALPKASASNRVLSFCFVDPYKLSSLAFTTMRGLAKVFVDFLVLIPHGMDARRNERLYTGPSLVVDRFVGTDTWRDGWSAAKSRREDFGDYIVDAFGRSMKNELGYKYDGLETTKHMRSTEKNLSIYRLAYFSRHARGMEFWKEALKYSTDQKSLF